MSRQPGTPKSGGRTKGTPNSRTLQFVEMLESTGLNLVEEIVALLPKLEPDRRVYALLAMLPYYYPKRANVTVKEFSEDDASALSNEELISKAKEILIEFEG